jgi:hypothetical protein
MTRTSYGVLATKCEGWWAVEIPGIAGAMTTAHSLAGIEDAARDLLAGLFGVARHSFDLDLAFTEAAMPQPREAPDPQATPATASAPAPQT